VGGVPLVQLIVLGLHLGESSHRLGELAAEHLAVALRDLEVLLPLHQLLGDALDVSDVARVSSFSFTGTRLGLLGTSSEAVRVSLVLDDARLGLGELLGVRVAGLGVGALVPVVRSS
jgi:hypothetical protein